MHTQSDSAAPAAAALRSPLLSRSYYVPAQSRPDLGQFFFAYSVTISNEGSDTVMLASRHWVITDGTGKVDHVR
jgi:uncharacterized protein affecting Mg2+/Co2+ transport